MYGHVVQIVFCDPSFFFQLEPISPFSPFQLRESVRTFRLISDFGAWDGATRSAAGVGEDVRLKLVRPPHVFIIPRHDLSGTAIGPNGQGWCQQSLAGAAALWQSHGVSGIVHDMLRNLHDFDVLDFGG